MELPLRTYALIAYAAVATNAAGIWNWTFGSGFVQHVLSITISLRVTRLLLTGERSPSLSPHREFVRLQLLSFI